MSKYKILDFIDRTSVIPTISQLTLSLFFSEQTQPHDSSKIRWKVGFPSKLISDIQKGFTLRAPNHFLEKERTVVPNLKESDL